MICRINVVLCVSYWDTTFVLSIWTLPCWDNYYIIYYNIILIILFYLNVKTHHLSVVLFKFLIKAHFCSFRSGICDKKKTTYKTLTKINWNSPMTVCFSNRLLSPKCLFSCLPQTPWMHECCPLHSKKHVSCWLRVKDEDVSSGAHLLSVPQTEALRRAPAVPPQSTSGRQTTPFAFSAWLCSSVGSASLHLFLLLLLLRRSSPASLLPPRGSWRSSSGERSDGTPGGGAKVRETEASAWRRRDVLYVHWSYSTSGMTGLGMDL